MLARTSTGPAMRALAGVALVALIVTSLAGCAAGAGGGERVRLLVTPVATPTQTPLALPTGAPTTYSVKPGDTLSGIAAVFGVSVDDIVRANSIADPNQLSEGQKLTIPGRSAGGTPTNLPPTSTPAAPVSPTLPPPNVTPPQGPTTTVPTPGLSSSGTTISPTAEP